MPTPHKIFDDKLIVGTASFALNSVRAACCLYNATDHERGWRNVQALDHLQQIPGKRVWCRFLYADGKESFICLDPGEYRTVRPNAANDVVVEPPETFPGDTLAKRLEALLDFCREFSSSREEIEALAATVKNFARDHQSVRTDTELFESADENLRSGRGNPSDLIQELFREVLLKHKMPIVEFSTAMALLQLQVMMGQWIEPKSRGIFGKKISRAYEKPMQSFINYTHTLAASPYREKLIAQLSVIGNANYRDASASVKEALNHASLVACTRELAVGVHQYFIALLVTATMVRQNLTAPLKYKAVQAEEGYACTITGLLYPTSFLFLNPDTEPARIAALLASGVPESSILLRTCSPIWPLFTKKFAKTLVATALTFNADGSFARGLEELHKLEREYAETPPDLNVDFERGWIDNALLKAYRLIGDEERTRAYAMRIAGQLVLLRAFAGGQ
jgi:hypothetical protein